MTKNLSDLDQQIEAQRERLAKRGDQAVDECPMGGKHKWEVGAYKRNLVCRQCQLVKPNENYR